MTSMPFSARLPLANLVELCQVLRHNLDAGVPAEKVFRQQAQKGSGPLRDLAERVHDVLKRGDNLEMAFEQEKQTLPPLFVSLAIVGERSGSLPEVFAALESYYRTQQKLRKQLVSQSMLPMLQLIAAVFVIAGLILVLGLIGDAKDGQAIDPLGVGLTGPRGAVIFLLIVFGTLTGLIGLYFASKRFMSQKAGVDALLLRLPGVGPCLSALALGRFSLAMRLTLETSLPLAESVRLSLRATDNAAFQSVASRVGKNLRDGLAAPLAASGVFPAEFCSTVAVAEESGRLPEVMRQQAKLYQELAETRLTVLMRLAGFGVWAVVALFIIIAIFRIVTRVYIDPINQFTG